MSLASILRKNRPLKNLHAGRRCFVLGTGPSLKHQNLRLLENEIAIVSNHFYNHPDLDAIAPQYWITADPQYWERPEAALYPLLAALKEHKLSTRLFLPSAAIDIVSQNHPGILVEPHFFHYDRTMTELLEIDFCKGVPPFGQNVMVTALMLAIYLGCSPIYMLGCDHSWWQWTAETYAQEQYERFYKGATDTIQHAMPFDEMARTIPVQRYEYTALRDFGYEHGIMIANATEGGFLDIFPRVDYESLFPADVSAHESPPVLGLAAQRAMEREDYEAAYALLERAKSLNVGRLFRLGGVDQVRALCLAKLDQLPRALTAARQALLTDPAASATTMRILDSLTCGEVPELQSHTFLLRPLGPGSEVGTQERAISVLIRLGETRFAQGDPVGAQAAFCEALQLDPSHPQANNNIGVIYWETGDRERALRHFETALAGLPYDRDTVLNCVTAYQALERYITMQAACASYLMMMPGDEEVSALLQVAESSLRANSPSCKGEA